MTFFNLFLVPKLKAGSIAITGWIFNNSVCWLQDFAREFKNGCKDFQFLDQTHCYKQGLEFYSKHYQQYSMSPL
jgi:hypothetical protein